MIVRLVKMSFRPEEAGQFQDLFEGWRHRIIAFPGCRKLELLHDIRKPGVFFTRSEWDSPQQLEAYRNSPLFADVWPTVKLLFADRAEAWSLQQEHEMNTDQSGEPSPTA